MAPMPDANRMTETRRQHVSDKTDKTAKQDIGGIPIMSARVLIADDSGTMRKIIIRSLNAIGVTEITEAADGAEALLKFHEDQFDLVLTDWNMPNKTGLDVIEGIRAAGSDVPIVMITTEAEKRRVLDAIRAGVTDYLVKPFEQTDLREKVEQFVN